MSGLALGIVLLAAAIHASWNYQTKKSRHKIVFIWWFILVALILYSPMFLYYFHQITISKTGWLCIVSTGLLHFLYFWFLGGAYERGELSLVYPLSRGLGLLLVPFLAFLFIQERLSFSGILGIGLIIIGIYTIHLSSFSVRSFFEPLLALGDSASLWALATGVTIAAYSLVDKAGVRIVFPPVYIYLMFVITFVILSMFVCTKPRGQVAEEWSINKWSILSLGFLVLLTYMMILFTMRLSQVSYVVAVREVSIVFSSIYGVSRLGEKHGRQKLIGAVVITTGVISIGLGG